MFQRFTDRARRVVILAQDEARDLGHAYIGTEHLLLGLIREGDGVAAQALTSLGVSFDVMQEQIVEVIGTGGSQPPGHVPFTPRAKKVLELSLRESQQLGHTYIGTEHILLGIVREGEGVAAQVLQKKGLGLSVIREAVMGILSGYTSEAVEAAGFLPVAGRVGTEPGGRGPGERGQPSEGPGPRCSSCGGDLSEKAAYRTLTALGEEGGTRDVVVVYCTTCGSVVAGRVAEDPQGEPETGE
jgi:ATP-dependent Clp protease ATP-binding subunit ClpC